MAIIPIDAASIVTKRSSITSRMPWYHVLKWQPFRIDALGLVTLLGADEINRSVGRLVKSRYTEYMPLLGAFVFAGNQFTDAYPGHNLYNLSAHIQTSDLAGWFQRWCINQHFPKGGAAVDWEISGADKPAHSPSKTLVAFIISFLTNGMLVAFTLSQGDWWGLGNALSMVISVIIRTLLVRENRKALDVAALQAKQDSDGKEDAKFLVILADSTAIKMTAPSDLIKLCFIQKPWVRNPNLYLYVRMFGWIGFGVHIISIGMSGLATQIITVFMMVVASVLTAFKFGCDENFVGCFLYANIRTAATINDRQWLSEEEREKDGLGKRRDIYIELDLSWKEEMSMLDWNLFPHRFNTSWWIDYYNKVALRDRDALDPALKAKTSPEDVLQAQTQWRHLKDPDVTTWEAMLKNAVRDWDHLDPALKAGTSPRDVLQAQAQWRALKNPDNTTWEAVLKENLSDASEASTDSNSNQSAGNHGPTTPNGVIESNAPNLPGLQPPGEPNMAQVPHAPSPLRQRYNPNSLSLPDKTQTSSSVHTASSGGSSNLNNGGT